MSSVRRTELGRVTGLADADIRGKAILRKVPVDLPDRAFWITLRQALLLIVSAIERRHLPHLSKRKIEHDSQTMV